MERMLAQGAAPRLTSVKRQKLKPDSLVLRVNTEGVAMVQQTHHQWALQGHTSMAFGVAF
jgi:hypothetical protein